MAVVERALPTVGYIARRFGVQVYQVLHVIQTRSIAPIGRAGAAHVYSDAAVDRIGVELRGIAEARASTKGEKSTASV
jgi:hypothetical protein